MFSWYYTTLLVMPQVVSDTLGRLASLYSVDFQHFSTITYTEICNLNLQSLASVEQD